MLPWPFHPPHAHAALEQCRVHGQASLPLIIGNNFGVANLNQGRPCPCGISLAFPGRPHRAFECPIRYWLVHGACPGWNANGTRVPSSWNGDDITTACQAQWRNFVTTLRSARTAGAPDVQF